MSDYIPYSEDLVTLILQHLPPQSLLRSRAVCKTWKHIIDSNSFILRHLSLQTPLLLIQLSNSSLLRHISLQTPFLLTQRCSVELEHIYFDPKTLPFFKTLNGPVMPQNQPIRENSSSKFSRLGVIGIAHGVICLFDDESLLLLWNPSIRRLLRLPRPHVLPTSSNLLSELLPDYLFSGFWIDPCTAHFKVVVFFYRYNKIAIFSSRNQVWTEVIIESRRFDGAFCAGVENPMILLGGVVGYWNIQMISGPRVVSSFDFEMDKFGTIEFPEEVNCVRHINDLIQWRDCLALLHYQGGELPDVCNLWAMKNGLWSKMFSFSLVQGTLKVLHVGEDYGMVLAQCQNEILALHDSKDGRIRVKLKDIVSGYNRLAYNFVESLVFPAPMKFL